MAIRINLTHASLQFSDSKAQKMADAERLFARCRSRKVAWITGTEVSDKDSVAALSAASKKYNYKTYRPAGQDCWIAVDNTIIKGGWEPYWELVIKGVAHRHTNRGVVAVSFVPTDPKLSERITVVCGHYLTKTSDPKNYLVNNKKYAKAIYAYLKKQAGARGIGFYGGDQNMNDKVKDTFFGHPITSAQDELKKWESTGFAATYDVVASLDADPRVKAAYVRALDDSEFKLNTDHYLVEAGYDVAPNK